MGMVEKLKAIHSFGDPHETAIHDVLLLPADGGEPRITPMTFSKEGAEALMYESYTTPYEPERAQPDQRFTVNVDLRRLYGLENMFAARSRVWTHHSQGAQYALYHNISPVLPINKAMLRLLSHGSMRWERQFWCTGDVVVVKRFEWEGGPIEHVDIGPDAVDFFNSFIPNWYDPSCASSFLTWEEEFSTFSPKSSSKLLLIIV
jgi:hypothetical protein